MKQNKIQIQINTFYKNHTFHFSFALFTMNLQPPPDFISQSITSARQIMTTELSKIQQFSKSHKYLKQPHGCQILNYWQNNLNNRLYNIKVEQLYVKWLLTLDEIKKIDVGKGKEAWEEFTVKINMMIAQTNQYQATIREVKKPYERISTGYGAQTQSLNKSRVLLRGMLQSVICLGQILKKLSIDSKHYFQIRSRTLTENSLKIEQQQPNTSVENSLTSQSLSNYHVNIQQNQSHNKRLQLQDLQKKIIDKKSQLNSLDLKVKQLKSQVQLLTQTLSQGARKQQLLIINLEELQKMNGRRTQDNNIQKQVQIKEIEKVDKNNCCLLNSLEEQLRYEPSLVLQQKQDQIKQLLTKLHVQQSFLLQYEAESAKTQQTMLKLQQNIQNLEQKLSQKNSQLAKLTKQLKSTTLFLQQTLQLLQIQTQTRQQLQAKQKQMQKYRRQAISLKYRLKKYQSQGQILNSKESS